MRRLIAYAVTALLVVLAVVAVAARHELIRTGGGWLASVASGYRITWGDQRFGSAHAALLDVHVRSAEGEPVLDAQRVDLWYSLRDLLPGSKHRYGITAVAVDRPVLTLIKHQDGTYNVRLPKAAAPAGPENPQLPNRVPIALTVRVRDASGSLRAPFAPDPSARYLGIEHVAINANINSQLRTSYTIDGAFTERTPQPFHAKGVIDVPRGFAMHHAFAGAVPLRTIGNLIINQQTSKILAGTATRFDGRAYALDVEPDRPIKYHIGASIDVADASLQVLGLARPIEHINGQLQLVDDAFFARSLRARVADVPVHVAGGIFAFASPQFRFGVDGSGNLDALRSVLWFAHAQPISGNAHVGTLIEGNVSSPIIDVALDSTAPVYRGIPLHDVHVALTLHNGTVTLAPLLASAGDARVALNGTMQLGPTVHSELVAHLNGPADALPYAGEVLGNEPLVGDAVLYGDDLNFHGSGSVVSAVDPNRAGAVFALAQDGVLDVEPAWLHIDGAVMSGGYALDRKNDRSAFWIDASHLALHAPAATSVLAAAVAHPPPVDGIVDRAQLAGGGPSGMGAAVGGVLDMHDAHVAGVDFRVLRAGFAGTAGGLGARNVYAAGSWGSIAGTGSFSTGGFAVTGAYDGTLHGLQPFLGGITGDGRVHGPASLAYTNGTVTVSSPGLALDDASIHGLPVTAVTGAAEIDGGVVSVSSLHARAANGDLVAAGTYGSPDGRLALIATGLDGSRLRSIGIPLDSGTVAANGTVGAGAPLPSFDGGVAVADGRSAQYHVEGTGIIHMAGDGLRMEQTLGALDGTFAFLDGRVDDLTGGARYALGAHVPAGDIARTLNTFGYGTIPATGTYAAALDVGGTGVSPSVDGPVTVAAGTINGLDYTNAAALFSADHSGASATNGRVDVASTHLLFSAARHRFSAMLSVNAPRARLEEFNNFFDTGDTLAGSGNVALALRAQGTSFSSSGDIDVDGFRYRALPFGTVDGDWNSVGNAVRGTLDAGNQTGRLHAAGTVTIAPSDDWKRVITHSRYNVAANVRGLDLNLWLAAFGFPQIPVEAHVDGNATVSGRYPNLNLNATVATRNAVLFRLPVDSFSARVSSARGRVLIDSAQLQSNTLHASATGSIGLRPSDPLDVNVAASTSDLPRLAALWSRVQLPVSGTFEATAHVAGTFRAPSFSAGFDATDATAYGIPIKSLFGSVRLAGTKLELRNAGASFAQGDATLAGTLPLQLQPFGIGPPNSPVSFDLALDNVDPAVFDAFLGNGTRLGGRLNGNLGIGGTVRAPQIAGDFSVDNGSYVSSLERTPITGASAQLRFDRTEATVTRLFARLGRGTLDGSGSVVFPTAASGLQFAVDAKANGAQLDFPAYGRGSLDGTLALRKRAADDVPTLSGTADLSDATIPFAAFLGFSGGSSVGNTAGPVLPFDVAFDLGLKAGRNVRIRGSGFGAGLDVGATGGVKLAGDLAAPTLDGRFDATSGTLTYFDRAFRVQSAYVLFDKTAGIIPTLHATGMTHVVNPDPDRVRNPYGSADVTIKVDGPIDNLKIGFDTNPPGYSKEQVIALIAPFGGFVGGVAFDSTLNGQTVGTAPGTEPLPGLLKPTTYGQITLSQEAFNILNAQFTAGLLSPLENALSQGLGFNDFSLTVDYYGNVGFSARKELGRFVNLVYASTFGLPTRQSYGLQYAPSDVTTAQLSFFFQNGPERLFAIPAGSGTTNAQVTTGLPLVGQSGFSFTLQRLFW